MKHLFDLRQNGFTLIEIITVLLLTGIMTALLSSYLGSNYSQSSGPIFRLQTTLALQGSMEKITAAYNASNKSAAALTTLQANIASGNFTTVDQTVSTNSISDFDPDNPHDNNISILEVTLTATQTGESLTVLFTQQE